MGCPVGCDCASIAYSRMAGKGMCVVTALAEEYGPAMIESNSIPVATRRVLSMRKGLRTLGAECMDPFWMPVRTRFMFAVCAIPFVLDSNGPWIRFFADVFRGF